jgi:hypothetical protein
MLLIEKRFGIRQRCSPQVTALFEVSIACLGPFGMKINLFMRNCCANSTKFLQSKEPLYCAKAIVKSLASP